MISIFKEMWAPPKAEDSLELTRLYRTIEENLQRRPGSSVSITCAHSSEHVLKLSYDLAWVGSSLLGKRVLVLDTTAQTYQPVVQTWQPRSKPQDAPFQGEPTHAETSSGQDRAMAVETAPKQALVDMDRALREPNSVGLLSLRVSPSHDVAITPQLTEIWGKLQTMFDLIIVAAPPVLDDPTAACLGGVVDASVLVVPSGSSRQRSVTRAIELLTSGATPLIGVVMTDRRQTFPRWLRWMFGRS